MYELASYFLKSFLSGGILLLYYWFVLRNTRLYHFNRYYLLSITIFSLILPLLHLPWFAMKEQGIFSVNRMLSAAGLAQTHHPSHYFTTEKGWLTGYLAVSTLLLVMLLVKVLRIYRIKARHPHTRGAGFTLIRTQLEEAPFSFLNNIFWKEDISLNDPDGQRILRHELAHIGGKHTYDKVLMQIVACLFWINPLYWIIRKELNLVHEFIADSESVEGQDTAAFARMLLLSYGGSGFFNPSHSFSQSPVKRRLFMIAGTKRVVYPFARKLAALPLLLLVFASVAFTNGKKENDSFTVRTEFGQLPAGNNLADKHLAEEILSGRLDAIYILNNAPSSKEEIKSISPMSIKSIYVHETDKPLPGNKTGNDDKVIEITTR